MCDDSVVPVPKGFACQNMLRMAVIESIDHHDFGLGRVKRSRGQA